MPILLKNSLALLNQIDERFNSNSNTLKGSLFSPKRMNFHTEAEPAGSRRNPSGVQFFKPKFTNLLAPESESGDKRLVNLD